MSTLAIQPRTWDSAVTGRETTRYDAFREDRLIAWVTVDTTTERWFVRELHVDAQCPEVGEQLLGLVMEKAARQGASVMVPESSPDKLNGTSGVRRRLDH